MLIELIAYRIGEPVIRDVDAFWIYSNISKDQLAEVLSHMLSVNMELNEENVIKCIQKIALYPGHEWVKVARVSDFTPVQLVDAKLN